MNMTRTWIAAAATGLIVAFAAPGFAQDKSEEAREKTIRLSEVPKAARDAAQKALGTAPTEAKLVSGTQPQEYELEAKKAGGKEMSVHVTADGKVVKTESEENEKK
ncbi:MAG: hypothetical protein ACJ8R9_20225 [Steroidobacteraceae bacterium]